MLQNNSEYIEGIAIECDRRAQVHLTLSELHFHFGTLTLRSVPESSDESPSWPGNVPAKRKLNREVGELYALNKREVVNN